MFQLGRRIILVCMGLLSWPSVLSLGQAPTTTPPMPTLNVVHVLGLEKIKRNAKCKLTVQAGAMHADAGADRMDVGIGSILDVFTAQDSKRLVGGTLGTISKFAAPYGSGRIISLFREKVDMLTLEYQDSNGGLHGVIFTLPKGQATLLKKELMAQGARASIPVEDEVKRQETKEAKKP